MEYIAPLLQTILWVALIGSIVWRFNKPLHSLLTALHRRIEAGGAVKAGPFELTELKPQDPARQKEKVAAEINDLLAAEDNTTSPTIQPSVTQAHYFAAEDLVLRAIQAEFGVAVSRQVTVGSDVGYDGAFFLNGSLHIVEVKYYRGWVQAAKLRSSLEHIARSAKHLAGRQVRIVLGVAFERQIDIEPNHQRIEEVIAAVDLPVVLRCYSMPDLRAKFGTGE